MQTSLLARRSKRVEMRVNAAGRPVSALQQCVYAERQPRFSLSQALFQGHRK